MIGAKDGLICPQKDAVYRDYPVWNRLAADTGQAKPESVRRDQASVAGSQCDDCKG
jgi:hypothetical protein